MIQITDTIIISDNEVSYQFVRSDGPGGQHVNKVSTAVRLTFDIPSSSLPEPAKEKMLQFNDRRITKNGQIVVKFSKYRSQKRNREAAEKALIDLIKKALHERKKRKRTRPSRLSRLKRLSNKKHRSALKDLRKKVDRG